MNELQADIEAIARFKAKLVAWAATAAPDEDALVVALALFDLSQPLIQQLVHQPAQRAVCDEHNGWYVKTTLDAVKAVLRDAFEACALAEGFAAIPQKVRAQAKHSKAARVHAVLADARQRMDAVAAGGVAYAPRHGGAHGRGDFALVDEDEEDSEEYVPNKRSSSSYSDAGSKKAKRH